MEVARYLDVLRERSAVLLDAARGNLDTVVPSCPGWTVADLVTHVGSTWGWAAAIVRTGSRDNLPPSVEGIGGDELLEWADGQARQVFDALKVADPGSSCWTFGLPRSRLFWFRRQALETAVHAWDVQHALGRPDPLVVDVACDGVDEFLAVMLPRQIQGQPDSWTGQSFRLQRTDGDREWTVRLGPGTELTLGPTTGQVDVTLRGPASSLYLWCLTRSPTTELEVSGDRSVADRWNSEIAF